MDKIKTSINTQEIKDTLLNFIVPLVSLLICVVLAIFYIVPTFQKMPLLEKEVEVSESKKLSLQTKVSALDKLSSYKAVVDENSTLVDKVLVNLPEEPKLLDEVNQIASNSGLKITRLASSGGDSAVSDSYKVVSVSLGVEGSTDQLILFLKSVEQAARFLTVTSFRFTESTGSEGSSSKLAMNISLDAPYMAVKSDAVTDDAISIDITSTEFVAFMNKLKNLKYYEFSALALPPTEPETKNTETTTNVQGAKTKSEKATPNKKN